MCVYLNAVAKFAKVFTLPMVIPSTKITRNFSNIQNPAGEIFSIPLIDLITFGWIFDFDEKFRSRYIRFGFTPIRKRFRDLERIFLNGSINGKRVWCFIISKRSRHFWFHTKCFLITNTCRFSPLSSYVYTIYKRKTI